MITEIGHFALILALVLAVVQSLAPLYGAHRRDAGLMGVASPAAITQFLFVAISFASLTYAYVTSDFSLKNVILNSHSAKPLIYKITGVWANHEGSMLLWVLILALFGGLIAVFARNIAPELKARVLSIQGMVSVAFLLFILFTSNPFERIGNPPLDGRGMNPLLQDFGLVIHPPFLYLGYVGFSVAFAFAVAALIEGRVDATWVRWARPWTLGAWVALTIGIGLGSWWAYYELGWGGWWYWDPVENASFIPWLFGTALIHSQLVVEKRDALKKWTILLAIAAFGFSLTGTFLVRSGVLSSVHAFAQDPARGIFILFILMAFIGGSLMLFTYRAVTLESGGYFAPVSREGGLLLNNLFMATAGATVFLGTLYPLFVDVLTGNKISVGPPFYEMTFAPIMIPTIIVMAVGPLLPWKRADVAAVMRRLAFAVIGALALFAFTMWLTGAASWPAALGIALGTLLALATIEALVFKIRLLREPIAASLRRAVNLPASEWGMIVAHIGFAVTVAGATAATIWQEESIQVMKDGETKSLAGYEFTMKGVRAGLGPNYRTHTATFELSRDGKPITMLYPEKRVYPVQGRPTTEAAIHTNGISDVYVAIGDENKGGGWVVRLYYKPAVPLIWLGCLLMSLGGLISLADRRLRMRISKKKQGLPSGATVPAE